MLHRSSIQKMKAKIMSGGSILISLFDQEKLNFCNCIVNIGKICILKVLGKYFDKLGVIQTENTKAEEEEEEIKNLYIFLFYYYVLIVSKHTRAIIQKKFTYNDY